jgi:DNA processing protein
MKNNDNLFLAALCGANGLGRAKLPELIRLMGSAQAVFEATAERLIATGLVGRDAAVNFVTCRLNGQPEAIDKFCREQSVRLLAYDDAEYPQELLHIHSYPKVLFVKGSLPHGGYTFGIVGSRACTAYGTRVARYFSTELAKRNIPIISGGARGIDTAAHKAALNAGGTTVAVLGCSLDRVYPEENAALFARIAAEGGAVISEYPPSMEPLAKNFPARNRIIAGMSQGILVAEAAHRSGAIITANFAVEEGRDVYCVPGNIFDRTSLGCHDLIRQGAKLVDRPEDILEDIVSWRLARIERVTQPSIFDLPSPKKEEPLEQSESNFSELAKRLLEQLQGGACTLEELVESSAKDCADVSMELLELQAQGIVAQDQAQRYFRR